MRRQILRRYGAGLGAAPNGSRQQGRQHPQQAMLQDQAFNGRFQRGVFGIINCVHFLHIDQPGKAGLIPSAKATNTNRLRQTNCGSARFRDVKGLDEMPGLLTPAATRLGPDYPAPPGGGRMIHRPKTQAALNDHHLRLLGWALKFCLCRTTCAKSKAPFAGFVQVARHCAWRATARKAVQVTVEKEIAAPRFT